MKKADRKRLDEALDKALAPPKQKPKQNLDALLDEYDEQYPQPQAELSQTRESDVEGIPSAIPTSIPSSIPTQPPKRISKIIKDISTPEPMAPLDATHTGAEKSVYSIMYRETISKGISERHFGPAELMKKTGIRSRNTVHKALYGLLEKLSVEIIVKTHGNPVGPRYRVYRPQEIERHRKAVGLKIDPQTKRIVEREGVPAGIPTGIPNTIPKNWDTTIPEIGIPTLPKIGRVYKEENSSYVEPASAASSSTNLLATAADDDAAALSDMIEIFGEAARKLTGRVPKAADREQWGELAKVIVAELNEAATRASAVSSVPAFLAAHLKRRFAPKPISHKREGNSPAATIEVSALATTPDPDRRLTPAEIAERSRLIAELLEGGYTIEQADEQFATSAPADDWATIRSTALEQIGAEPKGK